MCTLLQQVEYYFTMLVDACKINVIYFPVNPPRLNVKEDRVSFEIIIGNPSS